MRRGAGWLTIDLRGRWMVFLCVALGGAAGAMARFGLGGWVHARRPHFPWATLAINVTGALLLGFALPLLAPHPLLRALIATGFLGAYTTFSTFGLETALLIQSRRPRDAALYVLATLCIGIAAAWLGTLIAAGITGGG
jgi:fluoride exporter